jgi:hypothetical protein
MKKHFLFLPLLILLPVLLISCATFHVGVNSFSRQINEERKTYILLPGNQNADINDLEYIEYSKYVERALSHLEFTKEEDATKADLVIFLAYGIGEPKEHSYSIPIISQTGVTSKTTTGNYYKFGNVGLYSSNTTYTPEYGVTGYATGSSITFSRYIYITAYDLVEYRNSNKEIILWDTRIASVGSSGDLRKVFPVMIAASLDYIGKDTKGIKEIELTEYDSNVSFIKNNELK